MDIKKYNKLPMVLNNINLNKDITKPFKLDIASRTKTRNIFRPTYKDTLNEKHLFSHKLLKENIHSQKILTNFTNNYRNNALSKLNRIYIDLNKGITLYNNLNYNNLYFINNNSGINSNSLKKQNFPMKNKEHNFQGFNENNKIILKRNIRYNPLFENKLTTNI